MTGRKATAWLSDPDNHATLAAYSAEGADIVLVPALLGDSVSDCIHELERRTDGTLNGVIFALTINEDGNQAQRTIHVTEEPGESSATISNKTTVGDIFGMFLDGTNITISAPPGQRLAISFAQALMPV